jgi:hypothetical protein
VGRKSQTSRTPCLETLCTIPICTRIVRFNILDYNIKEITGNSQLASSREVCKFDLLRSMSRTKAGNAPPPRAS